MKLICDIGKPITWDVQVLRSGNPLQLPDGTKAWFTVKRVPAEADDEFFQLTEVGDGGIIFVDRINGWLRLRATGAQTATLCSLTSYDFELQLQLPGEDTDIPDNGRGTLVGNDPITAAP